MRDPLADGLDDADREAHFRRKWPPEQYPGLYLPADKLRKLRQRQRRRRELLDLIGRDIAGIAVAVVRQEGRRRD